MKKGIKVTYTSGATKIVYLNNIKSGRSEIPVWKDGDKFIKSVEEGEF